MKATIDLDDTLYRRLKVEAARRGRTVRELVADGIRAVIDSPPPDSNASTDTSAEWYGALSEYGANAKRHDLNAMRESIARARKHSKP